MGERVSIQINKDLISISEKKNTKRLNIGKVMELFLKTNTIKIN